MTRKLTDLIPVLTFILLPLTNYAVVALDVPIANADFDADYSNGSGSANISGWTETGSSMWFTSASTPDQGVGHGVAYFITASTNTLGTLEQTLTTNVTPHTYYTLSFTIFDTDQLSSPLPPNIHGRVYAEAETLDFVSRSTPTPDEKGTTWEYTYYSGTKGLDAPVALRIALHARTSGSFQGHGSESVYFDNVTLTAVPEPSLYAILLGSGCLIVALTKRRR